MPGGEGGGWIVRRWECRAVAAFLDGAYGGGMPGGEMGMLNPSLRNIPSNLKSNICVAACGRTCTPYRSWACSATRIILVPRQALRPRRLPPVPPLPPLPPATLARRKGMYAIAKTEAEKKQVDEVYFAVRDFG